MANKNPLVAKRSGRWTIIHRNRSQNVWATFDSWQGAVEFALNGCKYFE